MLEGPGGGVHGGDAGADVAGEVLEGFGGGLQAVEEGFGGGVDELALEVAEGEDSGVHVPAVCLGEGGVETEGVALGYADRRYWSVQTASAWRAYLLRLSPFILCLR